MIRLRPEFPIPAARQCRTRGIAKAVHDASPARSYAGCATGRKEIALQKTGQGWAEAGPVPRSRKAWARAAARPEARRTAPCRGCGPDREPVREPESLPIRDPAWRN